MAEALGKVDGHPRVARSVQLAIRFGVLTAARQAEVRRATWDEFDLDEAVWAVPEAHMKRYRPHRVPLSTGAPEVLEESRQLNGHGEFVFRAPRGRKLGRTAVADALSRPWEGTRRLPRYQSGRRRSWCETRAEVAAGNRIAGARATPYARLGRGGTVLTRTVCISMISGRRVRLTRSRVELSLDLA